MGNGGEGTGATTLYHAIMPAEMASVGSQDPNHISKTVPPIVQLGPPTHTVDITIFEMWIGSLSTHQGLSIPVV